MKHPRKEEGAVLFVVLMIVMVGTASALFSATTVSHEVRGTGFARQQLQTRYAARSALIGALEWFDIFGPEAVREIVQTGGATDSKLFTCTTSAPISCYPEPPLAGNRRAYRLYQEHFDALIEPDGSGHFENPPVDADCCLRRRLGVHPGVRGRPLRRAHRQQASAGSRRSGWHQVQVHAHDHDGSRSRAGRRRDRRRAEAADGERQWNETGADMRAYIVSGPFISGS